MRTFMYVMAMLALLYLAKTGKNMRNEIYSLKHQVADLKAERPEIYMNSCLRAVDRTCFFADCAITPIEVIKEKTCKPLEEE